MNSKYISKSMNKLSRKEKLVIFFMRSELNYRVLADELEVTPSAVRTMLSRGKINQVRYDQLLELGMPKELLPRPEFIKLGRKRK